MNPLNEVCLNLIVEKFERFKFAFSVANNENLKRNLKFLQRQFSYELWTELFKRRKLKDEYLDFLMNEHLKFLDGKWLKYTRYEHSIKDIFCRLPNLVKISCYQTTDEILENISKYCPKIVEIEARYSSVTDHGVKFLCKNEYGNIPCPVLKKLSIVTGTVTDKGVEHLLRNLKSLENLDHISVPQALYSLYKEDLIKLEKLPSYNLTELNLNYINDSLPYYNDLLKICLTLCPKLKSLTCFISDEEQFNSFNNTTLEDLTVTFPNRKTCQRIYIGNFLIVCGSKLITLDVTNCQMLISEIAVRCPKLKYLKLRNVSFLEDHSTSGTVFNYLNAFTFSNIELNGAGYKAMSLLLLSSLNLKNVKFMFCDLSPDTKTYILDCCDKQILKKIAFARCRVEYNFAKDILLSCISLETLDLDFCNISGYQEMKLIKVAERLPNKPKICINEIR